MEEPVLGFIAEVLTNAVEDFQMALQFVMQVTAQPTGGVVLGHSLKHFKSSNYYIAAFFILLLLLDTQLITY